jgi:glycosyltransferase involved in cell wall biosynthesis
MKVLTIVPQFWPIVGGAETQARRLSAELRRQGAEVEVWTGRWSRDAAALEGIDGVPVRRLGAGIALRPVRLRRWLFLVALLAELLRHGRRFDVFHVHQLLYPAFAAALAGRLLGRPVIARVSSAGSTSDLRMAARGGLGLQRALTRRWLARVVVMNAESERECLRFGYAPSQLVRIPNGVHVESAPVARQPGPGLRVLYAGGLRKEKRLEVLLEAWGQAGCPGTLSLAGDGGERRALEAGAARLTGVRFLGQLADVGPLYDAADAFVLSSDAEGMSNALLEAMAAGCACIATRVGGNVEALGGTTEGQPPAGGFEAAAAGLLVRVGDSAGLAAALRRLAEDVSLRGSLAAAAAERSRRELSLASVAERYRRLYAELLGITAA